MFRLSHLLLAFTLILPFAHTIGEDLDAALDSRAMAKKMEELAEDALGKHEIQRLIDDTSSETKKILDRSDKGELFARQV